MAGNMRKHEMLGLFYQFVGATCVGIGLWSAAWFAVRPLLFNSVTAMPVGAEWLVFPLLFGIGAVLWSLGAIELKDVEPTSRRRP